MYKYEYARPSVTATIAIVIDGWGVVQVRRGGEDKTYSGYWSLPGGFLEAKRDAVGDIKAFAGETIEQTAVREVNEELGVYIDPAKLQLLATSSLPDTDPRCHVVNILYAYHMTEGYFRATASANDEVSGIRIVPYNPKDELAFDHSWLMKQVFEKVIRK